MAPSACNRHTPGSSHFASPYSLSPVWRGAALIATRVITITAPTLFVGSGEAAEVTFTVPGKPGTYFYICTFAGHYQAGMKGTLVVR
jgi:plastocyanin